MKTARLVYLIHSWTGLLTAWLLFVICLTGTLVVYKFPMKALANPSMVSGPVVDNLGPDGALETFLEAYPDHRLRVVAFPSDIYSIHQYSILADPPGARQKRYWINPESGDISGELESDFADFVQRLHANLYMGARGGRWIVGVLGILMAVSVVSGLIFHWRRIGKDLWNLRLGAHMRKAWSDMHKFVGVWTLPFAIVIALTGAWLGLESLIGIRASSSNPIVIEGTGSDGAPLPIREILERAQDVRPDLSPSHVNFAHYGSAGSTIRVQGDLPGYHLVQRGQTMLVFDADSGAHLQTVDRMEQGAGRRVLAMMRPLHYGYFWPGWSEALYFLFGAGSTLATISGALIWAEREKKKRHPGRKQAPVTTRMERANVGVMGGFIAALAGMALLNGLARIPSLTGLFLPVGGLSFTGRQDLIAGSGALAPELGIFGALWLGGGVLLALWPPVTAWRRALWVTTAFVAALPVLSIIEAGSPAAFLARGAGEAWGYTFVCLLLVLCGVLTLRRISPARALAGPTKTSTSKGL